MPERIYLATRNDLDGHIQDMLHEFNVAEGPITAGDLVEFINSKNVADSWGTPSVGAPVVFESADTLYTSATILDSGKVLVTYQDNGNSGYGTACILNVNGTTITAGTPVVFESADTRYTSATTLDSGKVLVAYRNDGNSYYGTACVLTVSGVTITVGTPIVFESAITQFISAATLNNGKVLVAYADNGNGNYGTACVLTVSGTTITAGTPVVFESADTRYTSATTLDSGKVLVTYSDAGNSYYGTACVLTVSGTTVTAGTPVVFENAITNSISATTLDNGKVLVAYADNGNGNYGTACILTINGTTITAGTPVVFGNAIINQISATTLDSGKALVTYRDNGNSAYGTACILTVSGTTITAGTPVVFENATTVYTSATTLDSGKVLVAYQDYGNAGYGTACVLHTSANAGIRKLRANVSNVIDSVGTSTVFESANTAYISATTLDSGKVLVAYQDNGNGNYGTACILNINGITITAGTPVVFESTDIAYTSATTLDSGKVLVTYGADGGNGGYGTACVLTVSGTTITAGTPVVFENAVTRSTSATTLDSGKVLVAYQDNGNGNYGTACILTINGTTITAGTPVVFENGNTTYISATTLDSGKVLVAYQDYGNAGYGTACVLTVNGTTITAGTPVVFESAATAHISATKLDSGKALVTYRDDGNSAYGTACILNVNGTTITAGTPVVFEDATTAHISATTLDSGKVLVTYTDNGNGNYGTTCILTVSGTTITAGTPVVFESANTLYTSATTLGSGKVLVAHRNSGNYGTACILTTPTNITASFLARAEESKDTGQICQIKAAEGQITELFNNLIPGSTYYLDGNCNLTTEPTDYKLGVALGINQFYRLS